MNASTRLQLEDLESKVDRLPAPPSVLSPAEGFATGLAQTADAPGLPGSSTVSEDDGETGEGGEDATRRKPLEGKGKTPAVIPDGRCRREYRRWDSNPHPLAGTGF